MDPINQINDSLTPLQEDVTAMLLGNPATSVVAFTSFRKMVIQSLADEAAAAWKIRVPGKVGIACLVMMPGLRPTFPGVSGPQYNLKIVVRTFCDPRVNNTGLSPEGVALSNLRWLDGLTIEGATQLIADPNGDALAPNYDYPGLLVYDSTLSGPLPQDSLQRTAAPSIADDNVGNVTLSCADPAGVIYCTADGSPVQPGLAGQVYAGPFKVASGTVVRWLAWNPALLPSHVAQGQVSF